MKLSSKRKYIAVNFYIKKEKWSQMNNLNYPKKLKKEEQTKLKASRSKKIKNIRAEKWNTKLKINGEIFF